MVCSLLKNVANVVTCVIDQFLGGLLNGIIDLIIAGMSAVLGALSFILSFSNFNLLQSLETTLFLQTLLLVVICHEHLF